MLKEKSGVEKYDKSQKRNVFAAAKRCCCRSLGQTGFEFALRLHWYSTSRKRKFSSFLWRATEAARLVRWSSSGGCCCLCRMTWLQIMGSAIKAVRLWPSVNPRTISRASSAHQAEAIEAVEAARQQRLAWLARIATWWSSPRIEIDSHKPCRPSLAGLAAIHRRRRHSPPP